MTAPIVLTVGRPVTATALPQPTLPPMPQPTPTEPFPTPNPNPYPPDYRPTCPICGDPLPGLLAGCWKPACLTAELDHDALFIRADDL